MIYDLDKVDQSTLMTLQDGASMSNIRLSKQ